MVSDEARRAAKDARIILYQQGLTDINNLYLPITDLPDEESGSYSEISFNLSKQQLESPNFNLMTDKPKVYVVKRSMKNSFIDDREGGTLQNDIEILKAVAAMQDLRKAHDPALHIVQIFHSSADYLWYSMEAILNGATLQAVTEQMRDDPKNRLFQLIIIQQLMEVFNWLHTPAGPDKSFIIAHGDLHAANVMIDLSMPVPSSSKAAIPGYPGVPSVRVIDFGLGRLVHVDPSTFKSGKQYADSIEKLPGGADFGYRLDADHDYLAAMVDEWFPKLTVVVDVFSQAAEDAWFRDQLVKYLEIERRIDRALQVSSAWLEANLTKTFKRSVTFEPLVEDMRAVVRASFNAKVKEADVQGALGRYLAPAGGAPVVPS